MQKPFATKSSAKDSQKMLAMVHQRGVSENRSNTSEEAHTPKLSGKMLQERSTLKKPRQARNEEGQNTKELRDNVTTERVNLQTTSI